MYYPRGRVQWPSICTETSTKDILTMPFTNINQPMPPQYQVPHSIVTVPKPNVFDACLQGEKDAWNQIIALGIDRVCCPKGRAPYAERPWIFMPDSGRRFNEIGNLLAGSIPLTSVNTPILQFNVPLGYDGVIDTVSCGLTATAGSGFVEGSGDIIWRLAADTESNPRYLHDLGNIQFSIGSLTIPIPTPNSNLRVYSGDIITFYAAQSPTSAVNPAAQVVCSCKGWFYSR